uniref:SPX domain-containing protein n=1 Tax=Alexandrium monilatum TaxID=311494 RepID=A0A7S4RX16_9DINO
MKFGKRLETEALEKYRSFYIQYKELKKALKVFTGQERDQATVQEVTHWTSSFLRLGPNPEVPPEAKLNDVLESELKRVSKCMELQEKELRAQLVQLQEEAVKAGADRDALRQKLEELGEQIVELKSFVQLNFTGFRKILKKYDKWSKSAVLTWFMGKVMRAPLMTVDFEGLLLALNNIAMSIAEDPSGVQGSSDIVLLVLPKDTMWVKVQLAQHLRLLPAPAGGAAAAGTSTSAKPARPRTPCYYFDTRSFGVYSAYVADAPSEETGVAEPTKPPPCALLHLRDDGADAVSLVHTQMGTMRTTEVPLTQNQAAQLVKGEYVATPAAGGLPSGSVTAEAALGEFRSMAGELQAVAQSSSRRSCFCSGGSPLSAVVEEDIKIAQAQEWGGQPTSGEFLPCNILKIPRAPEEPPRWLRRIYDSPDVVQVSGFSLGLHAVARCCVKGTPLPLPHWYRMVIDCLDDEEEDEIKQSEGSEEESGPKLKPPKAPIPERRKDSAVSTAPAGLPPVTRIRSVSDHRLLHEFGPEPSTAFEGPVEEETVPATDAGGPGAPLLAKSPAPGLPVRGAIVTVQPKTLYSNERTFLEWIHFATLFAALGLVSMHHTSGVAVGRLLILLAIFLVFWSLNTFTWRAAALDKKAIINYHDPVGPPLLVLGILGALVLSCVQAVV